MPVDASEYKVYGGATVCILIKAENENIVFDAGSGFMNISQNIKEQNPVLHVFVTHEHFDHIMGFAACDIMYNKNATINIYGKRKNGQGIKQQIDEFMKTPIWPVSSDAFKANVIYHELNTVCKINGAIITATQAAHPGACNMLKLEHKGKKVVYTGDVSIESSNIESYANFCKDSDIIICDGQYANENMHKHKGFGHSSWQSALELAQLSNCKALYIIHHSPYSTDDYLEKIEKELKSINENYHLAKKEQVVSIC